MHIKLPVLTNIISPIDESQDRTQRKAKTTTFIMYIHFSTLLEVTFWVYESRDTGTEKLDIATITVHRHISVPL
jgi:hypothetical protein